MYLNQNESIIWIEITSWTASELIHFPRKWWQNIVRRKRAKFIEVNNHRIKVLAFNIFNHITTNTFILSCLSGLNISFEIFKVSITHCYSIVLIKRILIQCFVFFQISFYFSLVISTDSSSAFTASPTRASIDLVYLKKPPQSFFPEEISLKEGRGRI